MKRRNLDLWHGFASRGMHFFTRAGFRVLQRKYMGAFVVCCTGAEVVVMLSKDMEWSVSLYGTMAQHLGSVEGKAKRNVNPQALFAELLPIVRSMVERHEVRTGDVLLEVQRELVAQLGARSVLVSTGRRVRTNSMVYIFASITLPERDWHFVVEVNTSSTDAQVSAAITQRLELERAKHLAEVLQ